MKEKSFLKNVFVLVSGTTMAQGIGVLAAPILTRIYEPKEFGSLAIYISLLAIFALMGTLQYENAIPLPDDEDEAVNLLVLSLGILLGMVIGSGIILWLTKEWLAKMLNTPELAGFLWLLPLSLGGIGLFNILYRWHMRKQNFAQIARTKVVQSFGMIGTQIFGGLVWSGPAALLVGDVIGRIAGSGRLTYQYIKAEKERIAKITKNSLGLMAWRFRKFPLISSWSALFKELSDQLPGIFIAFNYGPQEVGWYMLVQRILGLPLSLLGYSVSNVFMAEAINLNNQDRGQKIQQLFWKTIRNIVLCALPVLLILALGAKVLVPLIFGNNWQMAGIYLVSLLPMYFLQFLAIPVSQVVYVFERQDLQFYRELFRLGLTLLVFAIVLNRHLNSVEVINWLAGAGGLAFTLNIFLSWLAIRQGPFKGPKVVPGDNVKKILLGD